MGLDDVGIKREHRVSARDEASKYMLQCPDDFRGYLVNKTLEEHCRHVRDKEWGGELEIRALSQCYGVKIVIIQLLPGQLDAKPIVHGEHFLKSGKIIYLAFYKSAYDLVSFPRYWYYYTDFY